MVNTMAGEGFYEVKIINKTGGNSNKGSLQYLHALTDSESESDNSKSE